MIDMMRAREFTAELARICRKEDSFVPIIHPAVETLLHMLIRLKGVKSVLEIGAGVGYSAISMASIIGADARITTIERYDVHADKARENCRKAGVSNEIRLIEGDATDILPCLNTRVDMIFLDAAKGQYISFLPHLIRLTKPGGLIVSDDVLYKGMVLGEKEMDKRKITIIRRLREYLKALHSLDKAATFVLPIADGVAVTLKDYI